jgi:hypothetical protein
MCRLRDGQGPAAPGGSLAYQGDPETGEPTDVPSHRHHHWRVAQLRDMAADRSERYTFFCGGSRNRSKFIDVFDAVFVLEVDLDTLYERLDHRPEDEFGGRPAERELILPLHRSQEDRRSGASRSMPLSRWPSSSMRSCGGRQRRLPGPTDGPSVAERSPATNAAPPAWQG